MSFAPTLDGYALTETNGITLELWKPRGPVATKTEPTLGGGAALMQNRLGGLSLDWQMTIVGATAAAATSRLDLILDKLHRTGEKVLQISDDRYLDVYTELGDLVPKAADGMGFTLKGKFHSLDAYWRDTSQQTFSKVSSATTVSGSLSVTGRGIDVPDFEIEETSGTNDYPGISVTFRNDTDDREFRLFSLDLYRSDKLVYLGRTGEIYLNGNPHQDSRTPKRIDGRAWPLENGSSTIEITHTATNDSNLTFRVLYYNRHHGPGEVDE